MPPFASFFGNAALDVGGGRRGGRCGHDVGYDVFGGVRGTSGGQPDDFTFAGEQVDGSTGPQVSAGALLRRGGGAVAKASRG